MVGDDHPEGGRARVPDRHRRHHRRLPWRVAGRGRDRNSSAYRGDGARGPGHQGDHVDRQRRTGLGVDRARHRHRSHARLPGHRPGGHPHPHVSGRHRGAGGPARSPPARGDGGRPVRRRRHLDPAQAGRAAPRSPAQPPGDHPGRPRERPGVRDPRRDPARPPARPRPHPRPGRPGHQPLERGHPGRGHRDQRRRDPPAPERAEAVGRGVRRYHHRHLGVRGHADPGRARRRHRRVRGGRLSLAVQRPALGGAGHLPPRQPVAARDRRRGQGGAGRGRGRAAARRPGPHRRQHRRRLRGPAVAPARERPDGGRDRAVSWPCSSSCGWPSG